MTTQSKRIENKEFGEYAEQMAHFLGDPNIARDHWTPREIAEYFRVHNSTVYYWIHRGYIDADATIPSSPKAKRNVGRYLIAWKTIDEIEVKARELIPDMKRHWPRMVYRAKHGMKVR